MRCLFNGGGTFFLPLPTMQLIDTHTHLYATQFSEDREAMLARALAAGVQRFYLPAIDSTTHEAMLALEAAHPHTCIAMMGLHPCSVNADVTSELQVVEKHLQARSFVAVGEIGLDFYWDRTYEQQQIEAFKVQIEWALAADLPIVIHTRKAMQATLDIVKSYKGRGLRGIFHCFSDHYQMARQVIDCGFLLGIGGVLTYKNAGLAQTLQQIPLEHLVLETDAPYLTPVPHRGKRNESSYLTYIASALGAVYGISVEEVAAVTTANALQLFHPQGTAISAGV